MKWQNLALLFSLLVIVSHAQEGTSARKLRFGLKASPNIGWMKPDVKGLTNEGARIGFTYGLITDISISGSENYFFGAGLEVMNMGGKLQFPNVVSVNDSTQKDGTTERTYKMRYLNIPLTLKLKTKEIGYITYFGLFGLDASVLLRARGDDEHTLRDVDGILTNEDVDIYKELQPYRVALNLGIGAEYNVSGNTYIIGSITFSNGFLNILKGNIYEIDDDGNVKYQTDDSGNVLLDDDGFEIPKEGPKFKTISNLISLNIGVSF